ncbi:unnamed protein product [Prunus armeniaca]|uniref:Apple domain-containing protein n=1 Tax=Prunus armeniaca TaxID=36596 RepID=A0A6J5UEG8_PRUAR|nr:unnamed protein product [Prunus armeniaca]
MDSGNLVLFRDGDDDLWQSFQNATDTFIPGMVMDTNIELTSWRDQDDPGIGRFTFKLDQEGDNHFVISRRLIPDWTSGKPGEFCRKPGEFCTSTEMPSYVVDRLSNFSKSPAIPIGFKPQFAEQWETGNFSGGCERESTICSKDTFLRLKMMNVGKPDTRINVDNETGCRNECLNNCQCQAFSYVAEYGHCGHDLSVRVALESTVRDCKPCGTTVIPYPLSTGSDCGDPMYFRFNCNTSTGLVRFVGQNKSSFRVISISPSTRRFVIREKDVDNCDPRNTSKSQQLNLSLPFKVINWCNANLNAVELGWEPLTEPSCTQTVGIGHIQLALQLEMERKNAFAIPIFSGMA